MPPQQIELLVVLEKSRTETQGTKGLDTLWRMQSIACSY